MVNRIVFWRAQGCYASALNILEAMEPKVGHTPIFIRKLEGSNYVPKIDDYLINWGNGGYASFPQLEENLKGVVPINSPYAVNIACNKIKTFKALDKAGVSTLKWTTKREEAIDWYNDNKVVIGRKTVTGCCGEGIEIYDPESPSAISVCPLYTLYQKKKHEYRVHVFKGEVIDIVQKRLKKGVDHPTKGKIRNVDDGWVFCHDNIDMVDGLGQIGIDAVKACGLDFGAVDIIWNQKLNKLFVVEVNTAPGLESSTIKAYAEAFLKDSGV